MKQFREEKREVSAPACDDFSADRMRKSTAGRSGYTVYYVDTAGTRLMESNYVPSAQTFDELMDELIEMAAAAHDGFCECTAGKCQCGRV